MSRLTPSHVKGLAILSVFGIAIAGALFLHFRPRSDMSSSSSPDPNVVARVGEVSLRVHDVVVEAERRHAAAEAMAEPGEILEDLVDREALIRMALEQGIHHDRELRRLYENMLIGRLREREVRDAQRQITVSDEEISAFYQANLDAYRMPAQIRVALLRLRHAPDDGSDALEALKAVRSSVLEGASGQGFGELAIENSDHQSSRYRGGDIGWLRDGQGPSWLPDRVVDAAWRLTEPGAMSGVIDTDRAAFLVRLLERRESRPLPLDEVSARIEAELRARKRKEIEDRFMQRVRDRVDVHLYPDRLGAVVKTLRQRHPSQESKAPPSLP